ncbi:MAG: thioesterase family protein [Selenomonadaceae bacterium]|nr:thioesterase family protein [Selenomonadaceae bacterium]
MVTENDTALAMKSGSLKVLATPKIICLVEEAAATLAEKFLPAEYTSVGTNLNVNHTAPSPIGAKVHVEVELIAVDGRKLIFNVAASDNVGKIFNGTHERFIVNREKFQAKSLARAC